MGRLAMRVEGDWWVAYYALPDSMKGALRLGKVHMTVVQDKERKQAFMDLFKSFIAEIIKRGHGADVEHWAIESAPEHERSGRA